MTTNIIEIQKEIKQELANKSVLNTLVSTTFKGLKTPQVYLAIQEGILRGFKFKDFLEKNVYAIPFRETYSLVTSIDYARKIGMRSGVVGKSKPEFEEKDDKILSCTITVKRKVDEYIGEYSATAFFNEYSTGRNLWTSKPRTMIAKVAEMHALRMACPEELAQVYIEEDYQAEAIIVDDKITEEIKKQIDEAKTVEDLKVIYKKNEGLGKEFAKLVTAKKQELNENS